MEFLKNFAITVKGILFSPKEFFDEITFDAGWKEPLIFFSICASVFTLAMSSTATFIIMAAAGLSPALAAELRSTGVPVYFMIHFATVFISMFIGSQIISAATTIALHFLGGHGSFQRTFTVLSCCWVVLLFNWIPIIGWIAGFYYFYLAYVGLAKAHDVSGLRAIFGLFLGTGTIVFVSGAIALFCGLGMIFNAFNQGPDDGMPHDPAMRRLMERYQKTED